MRLAEGFYVVGVYEDVSEAIFPTHALPIVACYGPAGYQRWNYRIEQTMRLSLLEPVGKPQPSPEKLFPVLTYHLCNPLPFSEWCQTIVLSADEVVVETRRTSIAAKLVSAMLRNLYDPRYLARALRTMWNALPAAGSERPVERRTRVAAGSADAASAAAR